MEFAIAKLTMPRDAAILCPRCKANDCRRSAWLSSVERRAHRQMHPYRCRQCSHRFHLRDRVRVRQGMIVGGALVSLALLVVTAGTLLHWSYDVAPDVGPVSDATPVDPHTLRSAQQGDAEAQFRIARILLSDPVPDRKNATEAVRWLNAAAEQDHTAAMVQLGKLYRSGLGVLQNFGNAAKWIETAAVLGDPDGMHELGRLYRDGVGFDRDTVKAYIWFSRSAAALNTAAVRDRDDVARGLSDDQLKDAQRKSAVAKNAPAGDGAGERRLAGTIKLSSTEKTGKNETTD